MNILGKDTFFSICFLLISAATGMGMLTLPWAFRQTGLIFGVLLLLYWSVICGSTIYFLIIGGLHYKVSSITELVYYSILGEVKVENLSFETKMTSSKSEKRKRLASNMAVLCDILILFDCLFIIPCLLIFISDFLVPINFLVRQKLPFLLKQYPGLQTSLLGKIFYNFTFFVSHFFLEKYRCVLFLCTVVFLLCIPNNFSAVRLVSILSVISSISTITIILYYGIKPGNLPDCSEGIVPLKSEFCKSGKIEFFNVKTLREFWRIGCVSNIILFSHFCHLILIPTTKNINHMSRRKIKGIVLTFISAIFVFNCSVGISGYSVFRLNTLPNIINNFAWDDPLMILTRAYLTLSLTVTICIETVPLVDSFSSTIKVFTVSIKDLMKRKKASIETEMIEITNCIDSNTNNIVDEETISNNCTSTLASTTNFTPYIGVGERKIENSVVLSKNRCGSLFCVKCPTKKRCFKILNLIIVLGFSGIMAIGFGSVAKLIQVTGGTLDGIFVFIIPAWVYYSTYFQFYNKFLGSLLLSLYLLHFITSSLSGIAGMFET
ncbi:Transmembrane amino acid transporter protein [Cryptosporidium felis]|nr:Transmembrane amino acid transporter protein [Cryptosporidium felis]